MATDNVIPLTQDLKNVFGLPDEVFNSIAEMEQHVHNLMGVVDKAALEYVQKQEGGKLNISIPIEAFARLIGDASGAMDANVDSNEYPAHQELRTKISHAVVDAVKAVNESSNDKVFAHDIYLGVTYALISFVNQHRIYEQMMMKKGDEANV